MTRKTHRQRRRAYERRRRTRRRQQRGGNNDGQLALTKWLLAAVSLRDSLSVSSGSYTAPWDFGALRKPDQLRITPLPGGPLLPRFEPSSLGDIITNIAATFDAPIPNGQTFNAVMTKLKSEEPDVYSLLQRLEAVLREEALRATTREGSVTVAETAVDLTSGTLEKPHFLWIAYANLQAEEPEHPVLMKELPAAPTQVPAAPSPQAQ